MRKEVNGLVVAIYYLNKTQISNLGEIVDSTTSEAGTVTDYKYLIRWYDKTDGIFPKILQVFRLSCGQLMAANFPHQLCKSGFTKTILITSILMNHYIFMIHQVVGVEELLVQ